MSLYQVQVAQNRRYSIDYISHLVHVKTTSPASIA